MLRKDRLLELADYIEKMEPALVSGTLVTSPGFSMKVWYKSFGGCCGTAMCIGGTADLLFNPKKPLDLEFDWTETANLLLENPTEFMERERIYELFYPGTIQSGGWNATPQQAAFCIRELVRTGEVNWTNAINGYQPGGEDVLS